LVPYLALKQPLVCWIAFQNNQGHPVAVKWFFCGELVGVAVGVYPTIATT